MSVSDPRIGSQIGDYSVDDLLGEGGMGKVYTATGPDGGRVALKLVKDDYARDETFRRRFYREARIAQTVPPTTRSDRSHVLVIGHIFRPDHWRTNSLMARFA